MQIGFCFVVLLKGRGLNTSKWYLEEANRCREFISGTHGAEFRVKKEQNPP